MGNEYYKRASQVKSLLAMLLLVLLALPCTSLAAPILKLEFKALPDIFISGTTLDLPLYLVEHRDAAESSRFSGYPASPPFTVDGPFPLASIYSELTSTQSQFVSFTPVAGFDVIYSTNNYVADHEIVFDLRSTDGIPVVVDNSGIVGRTEILIGAVRVVVGLPIPQDDGIGGPDPDVVFWVDLSAQMNHGHNASLYLGPSGTDNVGELFLGGILSSTYKILAAPNPPDPGTFTVAALKSYKSSQGTVYPNFKCNGVGAATCNGKAQLFVMKKVGTTLTKKVYGTCIVPESTAPNRTYCILKLTKAARAILKSDLKLKATLSVASTGVAGVSKIGVTIK
jgi:hypothetical protein